MVPQGDTDANHADGSEQVGFIPPEARVPDSVALEYERLENRKIIGSPKRSVYGSISIGMFAATLCLFFGAWAMNSPQSENDPSAFFALFSLCTSLAGLITGIIGLKRPERNPELSKTGICLNGLWLLSCGALIGIAYSIFGGMRGSDFH